MKSGYSTTRANNLFTMEAELMKNKQFKEEQAKKLLIKWMVTK